MCGRYCNDRSVDDLAVAYQAAGGRGDDFMAGWKAMFSIPPTTAAPIVRERVDRDGVVSRELALAEWGLRPPWMSDPAKKGFHNARLEAVADKPSFRAAFASRRVVVPMNGYYEWVDTDAGKQPYFIRAADSALLSAAGVCAVRKDEQTGRWQVTYTVITCTARDAGGEVHERMPVFLSDDAWPDWIAPGTIAGAQREGMLAMLDAVSQQMAGTLEAYPVSKRVNDVRTALPDDATLLDRVAV